MDFNKLRLKCPAYKEGRKQHECGAQMFMHDRGGAGAVFADCAEKTCPVVYWTEATIAAFARGLLGDKAVDKIIARASK